MMRAFEKLCTMQTTTTPVDVVVGLMVMGAQLRGACC